MRMRFATGIMLVALTVLAQPATAAHRHKSPPKPHFDLKRPEIVSFVQDVSRRDGLPRRVILKILSKGEPQPKILEAMSRPAEKVVPWYEYRDHFLTEERVADGAQFYLEHRDSLERVAGERGIAPEYIVAILGVETKYGRTTGHYRVLDALMTLGFDYPPRGEYFREELEQFLLLTTENHLDPLKITGSYAGAMGAPQFMPSSYRKFAIDGNTDGRCDLFADWEDVLASIANYFVQHGWEPGGPVLAETRLDPDPKFQFDPRNLELNETVESLSAEGVEITPLQPGATPAVLVSAEQQNGPAYRVGFHNFYVLTRYNRSARYAMAVHDLATAIAGRVRGGAAPGSDSPAAASPGAAPGTAPALQSPEPRQSPAPAAQSPAPALHSGAPPSHGAAS